MARTVNTWAVVAIIAVIAIVGFGAFNIFGLDLPSFAFAPGDDNGDFDDDGIPDEKQTSVDAYYVRMFNHEDEDATAGDADIYGIIWNQGDELFTGSYVEKSTNFTSSTAKLTFDSGNLLTNKKYSLGYYQGDAGTNIYPGELTVEIPYSEDDSYTYTDNDILFYLVEGSFTESACDSATAGFDEASDSVSFNKSIEDVEGTQSFDCVLAQATAGGVLKDAVIIFRDSPSDPLTDINDIEAIYLSVKSGGSGVTFPTGNLQSEFKSEVAIPVTADGMLRASNDATITVKIQLPAAEADVGTGSMEMIYDDLGSYRAKGKFYNTDDGDVHAAAEITTFKITTT